MAEKIKVKAVGKDGELSTKDSYKCSYSEFNVFGNNSCWYTAKSCFCC